MTVITNASVNSSELPSAASQEGSNGLDELAQRVGVAANVAFRPSGPSEGSASGADINASRLNGIDVEAERVPNEFHFRKTYSYTDEEGKVRQHHVNVELKEEDSEKAQGHYQALKKLYPEMTSFDLNSMVMKFADGKHDMTDNAVVADHVKDLRALFRTADKVEGFAAHRWPDYHKHGRGDMGAEVALRFPSERAQRFAKLSIAEILEMKDVKDAIPEADRKKKSDKIDRAKEFVKDSQTKIGALVKEHKALAKANPEEFYNEAIQNLEELGKQFASVEEFPLPLTMAILLEGTLEKPRTPQENVELLEKVFRTVPEKNSWSSIMGTHTPTGSPLLGGTKVSEWAMSEVSTPDKNYIKDMVLLASKDKDDYLDHSKELGVNSKRDPLVWVVLNAMRQTTSEAAEEAVIGHPLVQGVSLRKKMRTDFGDFVKEFVAKNPPII